MLHIMLGSIIGFIPVPFIAGTRKFVIAFSTVSKLSPFEMPRAGTSIPVYFTH